MRSITSSKRGVSLAVARAVRSCTFFTVLWLLQGCTTVSTSKDYVPPKQVPAENRSKFVVLPGIVKAEEVVSDSSVGDRPLITESNDFLAQRLSESIAAELESNLRQAGFRTRMAEGEAASPAIAKVREAFPKVVEQILKNVYTSVRSETFEYQVPEAMELGKLYEANSVVLAVLSARLKSGDSWKQNLMDSATQAAVLGTAKVFSRSSVDLHIAVVNAQTGKVTWFNTRGERTLLKDGTTPAAVREMVAETFRPFLK